MSLYVQELRGFVPGTNIPLVGGPTPGQIIAIGSSASTGTLTGIATSGLLLSADTGCYVVVGSSTGLPAGTVGSSNGIRVPAGVAPFAVGGVTPFAKLFAIST